MLDFKECRAEMDCRENKVGGCVVLSSDKPEQSLPKMLNYFFQNARASLICFGAFKVVAWTV